MYIGQGVPVVKGQECMGMYVHKQGKTATDHCSRKIAINGYASESLLPLFNEDLLVDP
jgi:hypothetical protein